MNGFRPMQWDCAASGCFNATHRLDFGHFFDCLPGRISFSDVDATVEVNGCFLFLEFKKAMGELPVGQRIYFERLTLLSDRIYVMVVAADIATMTCAAVRTIWRGKVSEWRDATLDRLKAAIRAWVNWATGQERLAA
jgi:hypothetical protein